MGLFGDRYSRPGPGIEKDAPKKEGLALFWDILVREFFELVKLNLLFLLFCIPIITIPAALTAMSRITLSMVRDEPYFMWTDFLRSFRTNFRQSLLGGAPLLLVTSIAGLGVLFYGPMLPTHPVFYLLAGICFLAFVMLSIMDFYFFPMVALLELKLVALLKNALYLGIICLLHNFAAFACIGVLTFLMVFFFPVSFFPLVLLHFSFTNLISVFCAYAGLRKYVIRQEEQPEQSD